MPDAPPRVTVPTPWPPIPILMYHAVETAPRPPQYKHFYVLADEFARQMRGLKRAGYTALTFEELMQTRRGERPLPPRPVLLTFDDGYANLWENVHPLLRDLGLPYTVFLVSEKIGGTNDWVAAEGYEATPLLTWEQIHQMRRDGVAHFEAHTATHPRLTRLPLADARREIAECKSTLEEQLRVPVQVLCYPYGDVDDVVADSAREAGFTIAVTTRTGRVRADDDLLRLPRLSVYHVPPFSLTYGVGILNFWWRVKLWKDTRP